MCLPCNLAHDIRYVELANRQVESVLRYHNIQDVTYDLKVAIYSDGMKHTSFVIGDKWRIQFDYTNVSVNTWWQKPFFKILDPHIKVSLTDIHNIVLFGVFFRLSINEYNTCTEQVFRLLNFLKHDSRCKKYTICSAIRHGDKSFIFDGK